METETKPTPAPKAAVKPNEIKKSEVKTTVAGVGEVQKLPVPTGAEPNKIPDQGRNVPASSGVIPKKEVEAKPELQVSLKDFDAFLKIAPKEWLPTLMVRIAKKCLSEKVFASPAAMAEAIAGASKK